MLKKNKSTAGKLLQFHYFLLQKIWRRAIFVARIPYQLVFINIPRAQSTSQN